MDFIERILGFSPDGGDGSFELLLFAIAIAGVMSLLWRWRPSRARHDDADRPPSRGLPLGPLR